MKTIEKDELFEHLGGFLKTKGIEIKEGSYAQAIRASCGLLTDAINLGQQGIERAKTGLDKSVEQMRQVIHEKTAPKPPASPAPTAEPAQPPTPSPEAGAAPPPQPAKPADKPKTGKRKAGKAPKAPKATSTKSPARKRGAK